VRILRDMAKQGKESKNSVVLVFSVIVIAMENLQMIPFSIPNGSGDVRVGHLYFFRQS
jgi:hypothetical protein